MQAIGGRRTPTCRQVREIDGTLHAFFVNAEGKMTCLTLAQFLANSGAKVRG